ncbi:MAG: MATE family efflux transporter [Lachnospiraceae bacterium]|nr:MATE family efflux transporter [Lachnospiraceae bacterium]
MIHGSLADKILLFALPLAATALLQQLFNSADIAVVGRFASSEAMAAVGSTASVIGLLVSLFMGISVGANVVVANLIGADRREKINEAVHTIMTLGLLIGILLLFLGFFLARPILTMMGAPENVMELAILYLRIYFMAMPGIMTFNFGSAVLRSKGDSKRPLLALTLSGVFNVILNVILVVFFHLHVIGVGTATVVSNYISAGLVLYFLMTEEPTFKFEIKKMCMRKEYLSNVIKIGVPAGIQGMVFSFSNVMIQSTINGFGSNAIAGSTAAQNLEFMSYCIINSFAQTAVTFTSQNCAAGDIDRCKKVYRYSNIFGLGIDVLFVAFIIIFRYPVLSIFTTDPAVMEYAIIRIMYDCLFHYLTGTYEISAGCLRGMGHSLMPAMISICGTCVFRLFWVFAFVPMHHEFYILMLVYPISWVLTGTVMTTVYFVTRRKVFATLRGNKAI